jgi:hypothetical protein
MAMTARPIKMPAMSFTKKTINEIVTIKAIIPTVISTIAFPKPITVLAYLTWQLNKSLGMKSCYMSFV